MPTTADADLLVDTSAAVAFLVSDHEHHQATYEALAGRRLGLAGHAAFETFSVLSRMPPPIRRTAAAIGQLIAGNFPATRYLGARAADRLLAQLPLLGLSGGTVYDALVGAVAAEHGLPLVSRDRRALAVYRSLGVDARPLP